MKNENWATFENTIVNEQTREVICSVDQECDYERMLLLAAAPALLRTLERIELQLSTRTDKVIKKLMGEARAVIKKTYVA